VTNVIMRDVLCPFIMNLYYGCGAWGTAKISDKSPWPVNEGTPRFRRIQFENITAREVRYAAAFIYGLPEMHVEDVSFDNVAVSMAPGAQAGNPAMAPDMAPMQRAGLFACNVRRLQVRNVAISGQLGPALILREATDVEISGGLTRTPDADAPVIQMRNVDGAFIHGCQASTGTGTFLHLEGESTRQIVLRGNSLHQARQSTHLTEDVSRDVLSEL
jgi:hypothetical protein